MQLSSEQLFAVDSPQLLSGRRRLEKPADIIKFPLIHLNSRADWAKWLLGVGIDDADATHGPVLNQVSMVIDAAINGQGVALARTTLAAWDLINGHLRAASSRIAADLQDLLDHLREGEGSSFQDSDISQVAACGGFAGFAAVEEAWVLPKTVEASR